MTKARKKITTAAALATGICLFAGAAFASYNTANGYSAYKKALISAVTAENYTAYIEMNIYADGEKTDWAVTEEKYSKEGNANLSRTYTCTNEPSQNTYMFDGIHIIVDGNGKARVFDGSYDSEDPRLNCQLSSIDPESDSDLKMIRFSELLADTLTGDIKNNFVYVGGDDEKDSYELKLSTVQIPELFNAGISAMFAASNAGVSADDFSEDNRDNNPFFLLGSDPKVDSVSCVFDVDKQGRLMNNTVVFNGSGVGLDGNAHTMTIEMILRLSGYGTTVPDTVDINALDVAYRESEDDSIKYVYTDEGYAVTGTGKRIEITLNENGEPVAGGEELDELAIDSDGRVYN